MAGEEIEEMDVEEEMGEAVRGQGMEIGIGMGPGPGPGMGMGTGMGMSLGGLSLANSIPPQPDYPPPPPPINTLQHRTSALGLAASTVIPALSLPESSGADTWTQRAGPVPPSPTVSVSSSSRASSFVERELVHVSKGDHGEDEDTDWDYDEELIAMGGGKENKKKKKRRGKINAGELPVEILVTIFEIVVARGGDDWRAGKVASTLTNCARTCKLWANVALPILYGNCTYGVFEYLPPQPYRRPNTSCLVPYSESPFFRSRPPSPTLRVLLQQSRYWRTLLLSSFWDDELGKRNFTTYPYLRYVEHLDFSVIAWLVDLSRHWNDTSRRIREALLGIGSWEEGVLVSKFEGSKEAYGSTTPWELGREVLARIIYALAPNVGHLKSASVFSKEAIVTSRGWDDAKFDPLCTVPMINLVCILSKLMSLEICGQEHINEKFGMALAQLKPSLIGPVGNRPIDKLQTFALRITGPRRSWSSDMSAQDYFKNDKAFLDALNLNSVTSIDFDISNDWGWTLDHIHDFMLRQARTLKSISLKGIGDTVNTWHMFEKMGRKGCRVRALALENRHVHHPPVIFDPQAWSFRSGFMKKLRHLIVHSFQGITNSNTNYHMIDPTSFSILLKHHLFGQPSGSSTQSGLGDSSSAGMQSSSSSWKLRTTPPIKTLVLQNVKLSVKVPEQIGAFAMQLAPTLTTLEIAFQHPQQGDSNSLETGIVSPHGREQGRYKFIEVLAKLERLRRLKVKGYSAEILLCACMVPQGSSWGRGGGNGGGDDGEMANEGYGEEGGSSQTSLSRPRSPQRPSTPTEDQSSTVSSPVLLQPIPTSASSAASAAALLGPVEGPIMSPQTSAPPPSYASSIYAPSTYASSSQSSLRSPSGRPPLIRSYCPSRPGVPPAQHLFTNTWRDTMEEIELTATTPIIFTEGGGLVDQTLLLFTGLQRLRLLVLAYDDGLKGEGRHRSSGGGRRRKRRRRRRVLGSGAGSSAEYVNEDDEDDEYGYGEYDEEDDDFDDDDYIDDYEEEDDDEYDFDSRPVSNHSWNSTHTYQSSNFHPPMIAPTDDTGSIYSASSSIHSRRRRLRSGRGHRSRRSTRTVTPPVIRGRFTPRGVLTFLDALPRRELLRGQTVIERFVLGERYMEAPPIGCSRRGGGVMMGVPSGSGGGSMSVGGSASGSGSAAGASGSGSGSGNASGSGWGWEEGAKGVMARSGGLFILAC